MNSHHTGNMPGFRLLKYFRTRSDSATAAPSPGRRGESPSPSEPGEAGAQSESSAAYRRRPSLSGSYGSLRLRMHKPCLACGSRRRRGGVCARCGHEPPRLDADSRSERGTLDRRKARKEAAAAAAADYRPVLWSCTEEWERNYCLLGVPEWDLERRRRRRQPLQWLGDRSLGLVAGRGAPAPVTVTVAADVADQARRTESESQRTAGETETETEPETAPAVLQDSDTSSDVCRLTFGSVLYHKLHTFICYSPQESYFIVTIIASPEFVLFFFCC